MRVALICAVVENVLKGKPGYGLLDAAMAFRDAAAQSFVLAAMEFSVVLTMPAWRDALEQAHFTPAENRRRWPAWHHFVEP